MAATSLLAFAGEEKAALSERLALDYILENVSELKLYDVHKAINLFNDYGKAIREDFDKAKEKVLMTIGKFAGDEQKASLLIRSAILIAKADGNFSEHEQEILEELCRVVNLESSKVCKFEPEELENI